MCCFYFCVIFVILFFGSSSSFAVVLFIRSLFRCLCFYSAYRNCLAFSRVSLVLVLEEKNLALEFSGQARVEHALSCPADFYWFQFLKHSRSSTG